MANHKRKGPKSTRAGCLLCKPHKRQGVDKPTRQEVVGRENEKDQVDAVNDWWGYYSDEFYRNDYDDDWDIADAYYPEYYPYRRVAWQDDSILSAPLIAVAS